LGLDISDLFDNVVFLEAPTKVRLSRIVARDTAMFGYCDPGFYSWAAQYEDGRLPGRSREVHEKWLLSLDCNVIRLDARKTVSDNVEQIITCISK